MTLLCPPAVRNRVRLGLQTSRSGSVLTSPAARRPPRRPGPEGRSFRARLPPPVWRRPGCSGAAGGGCLSAGLRNFHSSGRTCGGSQASEAELRLLGSWRAPKFPQHVTQPSPPPRVWTVRLSPGPPHAGAAPSEPSFAPVPSLYSEASFFQAPPNTHQPRRLRTPSGRRSPRLLTSREGGEGLSQGEVARRPAEARGLWFLQ